MPESWATFGVDLHLERDTAAGRRAGLERALREAIRDGRLAADTRLPSSRALAADLGLSRGTVSAAYDQLVAEGYLAARHGSGTVVSGLARPDPAAARQASRAGAEPRHDLRPGQPDVSFFPWGPWQRASRRALAAAPAGTMRYGDPRGLIQLRTALAEYLGRARGVLAAPDQIVITSGYVQGLALLTRVLAEAGARSIAMEDPGLPFHREVVRRAGLAVAPLPVDKRGAWADAGDAAAVVVTPAHQYPGGATLHPARRRELAQWARHGGGLVIEDDYDGEFRYDRQPVGAVQALAPEHVVYAGSASKSLAPGFRLGWLVLPAPLAREVAAAQELAAGPGCRLDQLTLAEFIVSGGYDRHVRRSRLAYRRRRDRLAAALAREAPQVRVTGIAAGLHALCELPPGLAEDHVVARALARGLDVDGLGHYRARESGPHGPARQALVVGYGSPPEHAFSGAVARLCAALNDPA
ncbi:MAG TPA: PLP-dependent aminotransferase family protein [Streptosporangiaceae bacterium]